MEPSIALRTRLRRLLNEVIPAGGTEANTNFTDAELDLILTESVDLNAAASTGWLEKAGLLEGEIESYTTGNESYDLTSLKDKLNHAMVMANKYAEMSAAAAAKTASGVMLRVCPPKVL
ncbi:hypothetical protein J2TS6_43940 [Paenibacillus albilobatus]|uniref:Uncharacterized protein n=1 Tax=Paenibacillus albilobatus TaxID=2716884 RepID=A0A920CCX6_9BACL|nr:hypothetical protein [Paenibacillus albilobatus]GIO33253.1 hypothetical protein J2TS6_43940 [Paenibacillus albilobatus]